MIDIWSVWNMLHAKNSNYLLNFEDGWLFPYISRLRGREKHLRYINSVNRMVFGCPPKLLHSILFYSIDPDPWVSSPKATKFDEKKLEVVKPYIKSLFDWSERDFNEHKKLIDNFLKDENFLKKLNEHVSLEKKEAKELGLEFVKYKPKPKPKESSISLTSF